MPSAYFAVCQKERRHFVVRLPGGAGKRCQNVEQTTDFATYTHCRSATDFLCATCASRQYPDLADRHQCRRIADESASSILFAAVQNVAQRCSKHALRYIMFGSVRRCSSAAARSRDVLECQSLQAQIVGAFFDADRSNVVISACGTEILASLERLL